MARAMMLAATLAAMLFMPAGVSYASPFDGTWNVTLVCPPEAGAKEYTLRFQAQVKDGALYGQYGTKEQPPWQSIEGRIEADGSAILTGAGAVGNPELAMKYRRQGYGFTYKVNARFESNKGSGTRQGERPCTFAFVKR
jgi:hypothetical protein